VIVNRLAGRKISREGQEKKKARNGESERIRRKTAEKEEGEKRAVGTMELEVMGR
jgi:hypothetical protein